MFGKLIQNGVELTSGSKFNNYSINYFCILNIENKL